MSFGKKLFLFSLMKPPQTRRLAVSSYEAALLRLRRSGGSSPSTEARGIRLAAGVIIALIAVVFAFVRLKLPQPPKPGLKKAYIGKKLVWVKLAETPQERQKGLSGVKSLADDEGMLFVLPQKGLYSFWMKEMSFPLDFIWIDDDKVVDLTENLPPPAPNAQTNQIPRCQPKVPVDMVLEVNAGWIKNHGVKIGDQFYLEN